MKKFNPTPKEKWVLDRLKREGWNVLLEWQDDIWLAKALKSGGSWMSSANTFMLKLSRHEGIRVEFRSAYKPQLHFHWYFNWPTKKNWIQFSECEKLIAQLHESVRIYSS